MILDIHLLSEAMEIFMRDEDSMWLEHTPQAIIIEVLAYVLLAIGDVCIYYS